MEGFTVNYEFVVLSHSFLRFKLSNLPVETIEFGQSLLYCIVLCTVLYCEWSEELLGRINSPPAPSSMSLDDNFSIYFHLHRHLTSPYFRSLRKS